jgi:hypothetical protein
VPPTISPTTSDGEPHHDDDRDGHQPYRDDHDPIVEKGTFGVKRLGALR